MIHYVLKNPDASVFQRGTCHSEDEIPQVPGKTHEVVVADDTRQPAPAPPPGYARQRALAYPPIGEQLDAIWKILDSQKMVTGEGAAVLAKIKAVKTQIPKE